MNVNQDFVRFDLPSGELIVDAKVLEKMKQAMLSFFEKPDKEFPAQYLELRSTFREELRASAPWISQGLAGVGIWRLQNQGGRLALVRYPPPSRATVYLFHAALRPKNSGWEVVSLEHEKESGPE